MTDVLHAERIRELNDEFRRTGRGGRTFMTEGVATLPAERRLRILDTVRAHSKFEENNDPYREHDFGAFEEADQRIFWKIDYYDHALAAGASDPSDPAVCCRVLTIMLAEEY